VNEPKSIAGGVQREKIHPTAATARLTPELYRVAVERRSATSHVSPDERMANLILLLSDVVEAAKRCAESAQYRPGRGGTRRAGPTAKGELIQAFIESYAELRNRFPKSGRGCPALC